MAWPRQRCLRLNPPGPPLGVPRSGRSAQDTIRLAAIGGAIGWLAVCVVAALADPLLTLDVSDPLFRVAADRCRDHGRSRPPSAAATA